MKHLIQILVSLGFVFAAKTVMADGGSVYNNTCISCHGPNAVGMASPVIEGQNKTYLATQLGDFKSGKRHDSIMNAMNGIASGLDAATISSVAAYLSTKSACDMPASIVNPGLGDVAAGKTAVQAHSCASCHVANSPLNAPVLSGQKSNYLVSQLTDFRSGARKSQYMNSMAANLSDRDINDISAFFNSQRSCP